MIQQLNWDFVEINVYMYFIKFNYSIFIEELYSYNSDQQELFLINCLFI